MVVEAVTLRADAQRNLERILEAARVVFAEDGLDASVADVAERAGVGTATIFRRFATKDDLCAAILERELESDRRRARARLPSRATPPQALADVHDLGRRAVHRRPLPLRGGRRARSSLRPRIQELVAEVTARDRASCSAAGQKEGAIRRRRRRRGHRLPARRGRPQRPAARAGRPGRLAALRRRSSSTAFAPRARPSSRQPPPTPQQVIAAKPPRSPRGERSP